MLDKHNLFYAGRKEAFAEDFWKGITVEGLPESVEFLTRKNAYFSEMMKKKFYARAFLRPRKENIADKIIEQLSSQGPLEEGVQKVKK